jgi:hypothetical protein
MIYLFHCSGLGPGIAVWFSTTKLSGREKEARDQAPEASADRSDFLTRKWAISFPSQERTSTSLTDHLSVSAAISTLYSIV